MAVVAVAGIAHIGYPVAIQSGIAFIRYEVLNAVPAGAVRDVATVGHTRIITVVLACVSAQEMNDLFRFRSLL